MKIIFKPFPEELKTEKILRFPNKIIINENYLSSSCLANSISFFNLSGEISFSIAYDKTAT